MDKDAFICPAMLSADYMLMFTQYINLVHIGEKGSNTTQCFFETRFIRLDSMFRQ